MSERVSIIESSQDKEIIVVAPHGNNKDDINTAFIAEKMANFCDSFAIINRGWKKEAHYNYDMDHANCNNISHCFEDVVFEEFLEPCTGFIKRIVRTGKRPLVCIIHGVSDFVRVETGNSNLDVLIGNGQGGSLTCPLPIINFISYFAFDDHNVNCYLAGPGSRYAGKSKTNLNQYLANTYGAYCLQFEIVYNRRSNLTKSEVIANKLGDSIENALKYHSATQYMQFPELENYCIKVA